MCCCNVLSTASTAAYKAAAKNDSVVLIWTLKPPVRDGLTDIVVAEDPFTRWMEITPLPTRSSADVTTWFHDQEVCQYGTLMVVQSDHGIEFNGDFEVYLRAWGLQYCLFSI